MSSLAGALASPDISYKQDVEMHSSSSDDVPPDVGTENHPKQEEEMGDLFGEDSNVDFIHHGRLVSKFTAFASLTLPYSNQIVTII